MGFNESSIKRAYHANRNRIGEYKLEWLDVDEEAPKKTYRSIGAKVKEEHSDYLEKTQRDRLVKGRESKLCTYCMRELGREDISDFFILKKLDNRGKGKKYVFKKIRCFLHWIQSVKPHFLLPYIIMDIYICDSSVGYSLSPRWLIT